MPIETNKGIKRILMIILCALIQALNIQTFIRTAGLIPGGANGLTLLIQEAAGTFFGLSLPYTLINLLLNAVPITIGFRCIGKKFTLYSLLVISLSAVLTDLIPPIILTHDMLLLSVFGGIINGVVISLCLFSDCTTGGTDIIAIYFSQKKGMDSFNLILCFNMVLLALAGLLFTWEKALYSIIFQYVSTVMLHYLYRTYQQTTLLIVTKKPQEVCRTIYELTGHGATILNGMGSYSHEEREIVYSIISSSQTRMVRHRIAQIDPDAFTNLIKTEGIYGHFSRPQKD